MRREWHADHGHGSADFRTELTGGAWAKANLGCDIDGVRSSARGLAAQFCTDFGFCKSSSYSFKVYGERLSNILSLEWAAKMQFFYDGYLEGGADHCCSEGYIASYKPTAPYFDAREDTPLANHKFHARCRQIDDLKPRAR